MTREEALTVATMLVEAYPRDVKPETLRTYAQHFVDLERERAVVAVRRLVQTSKWLPSIAEVRAAAVAQDHAFPTSAEAFAFCVRVMSRRGTYRPMARGSGDPALRALEVCGRWEDVCQEDTTWLRKRYVEIYDGLVHEAREGLAVGSPPPWLRLEGPTMVQRIGGGRG